MYNNSEVSSVPQQQSETRTVADILARLSNGEAVTPSFAEAPAIPTYISTGTTPTLTPTTLANIEQSFIELSSLAPTSTTSTASYAAQDLSRQSGFVPPVIYPREDDMGIKNEYYSDEYEDSDPEWMPSASKRMRGPEGKIIEITPNSSPAHSAHSSSTPGPRRHTGPRPRRNEHLTPEENVKRSVRRERNKVAAAKCRQRRVDHTNRLINETENLEEEKATLENEIQTLQQQKEQLEFLLKAHKPMCSAAIPNQVSSNHAVKAEPMDGVVTTRPNTLPLVMTTSAPITATRTVPVTSVTEATGIAISTPSNGVFNTSLTLDIMTDGHTGLTPITSGPSCASQIQRNSSDSSPSEALASPTTLMAL